MGPKNTRIKNEIFIEILTLEKKLFPITSDVPIKDPRREKKEWQDFLRANKRFNTYLKMEDRVFAILLICKAKSGNAFIGYQKRYEISRVRSEKDMPHASKEIVQVFFLYEK